MFMTSTHIAHAADIDRAQALLDDNQFFTPAANAHLYARIATPDLLNAAQKLALACIAEFGVGDERTSEAVALYIRRSGRTPDGHPQKLTEGMRALLIERHRLDDMCPVHLEDLHRGPHGEICLTCDEDN